MLFQLTIGALALIPAYLVYLYLHDPPAPSSVSTSSTAASPSRLPSLLIPCITLHRRFLPLTAIHHFSYPLLYLGVDLDALEAHELDRGVFKYASRAWTALLTIGRAPYLANPKPRVYASLREELLELVAQQGVDAEGIGRVWLVTMPSYLGFTGINPLTVWYLYGKERGQGTGSAGSSAATATSSDDEEWVKSGFGETGGLANSANKPIETPDDGKPSLKAVVLEVHNTFGERHIYVLRVGHSEEPHKSLAAGLHHAWTFPRTFHVSPFNNRAGFYRLDIADPFRASTATPKVRVTLSLLTTQHKRKIYAVLAGNPSAARASVPLRSAPVCRALLRQPLDLLLTTPRILAQAWTLHFEKRLSVYPRPELDRGSKRFANGDAQLEAPWNPPEEDEAGAGRSIGWKASGSEKTALKLVGVYLEDKCRATGKSVSVFFDNPGMPPVEFPKTAGQGTSADLVLRTRHPSLFTEILMARTPEHMILSAEVDRHTLISSPDLFRQIFAATFSANAPTAGAAARLQRAMDEIRRRYLFFHTAFALRPLLPALIMYAPHFTAGAPYTILQRISMLLLLLTSYWASRAEEWVMHRMDARFVSGQAPWEGSRRIADHIWGKDFDDSDEVADNDKYGSVLPFTPI